jgi:hypothetical protein
MSKKQSKKIGKTDKYINDELARVSLNAATNAAAVVLEYGKAFGEPDAQSLISELSGTIKDVNSGNMKPCESMLVGQAKALQSIFVSLSRRANNMEYVDNFEKFLRLAFKAQSQCRATLETLSKLKNPPVVYAQHANISHGQEQVNHHTNHLAPETRARTRENNFQQNELLDESKHEQWLDSRTSQETSGDDKAMATMETINRG